MILDLKKQSNPFSTGGGGVNFETRIQALFAIALLTQSCVPCLSQTMRAKELKFQNKYDGSNTDDFVLVASNKAGNVSKLYAQIKHEITISESLGSDAKNSTFSEVINSAWKDFKSEYFDKNNDSIALITGPLPKLDIANTLPVLEWAKYSSSASDFIKKSTTQGFTSESKLKKLKILRTQLEHANEGEVITDEELWEFLRVFYLVSFDLDVKHSVVANLLCSLIQCYSDESPSLVLSKVITCVQEYNQNAGKLTLENTPEEVKELFQVKSTINFEDDFLKFQDRARHIYHGISNTIQGFHISRDEDLAKISEAINESNFVFVTGVRGAGKSSIVKDFISRKDKDIPIFYLRAEDLDHSHLNDVFSSIGMNSNLSQIEGYFSLLPQKILVIESIEKVLELDHQDAFIDLLQFIRRQAGWTIIATGRDYAFQQLSFNFLQPNEIKFSSVNIVGFSEEQVQQVCEHIPELKALISNDALIDILRIPFFIEIAVRAIGNGAQFQTGDTENDFRKTVWSSVIAKDQDRKSGMPIKRRKTFIEIATERAKKMVFGISPDPFDPEVISKLEEDNLIYRDQTNSTISLPHDVLEDWALEEFIEDQYKQNSDNLGGFLAVIGSEPAISRAFRLWLYHRLQFDESTYDFVENILNAKDIQRFWKDETIAAILQNDTPGAFLERMKDILLQEDCALLIRFCFILRITCQRPTSRFNDHLIIDEKSGIIKNLFLKPTGKGWEALINFIYEVKNKLSKSSINHIVELINEWCEVINIYDDIPEEARIVGLLAIWLLEPLKNDYGNETIREKILSVLLKVSPKIENEFDQLMLEDVFISRVNSRRLNYVEQLTSMALVGIHVPLLCKFRPDFITKLAMHKWLLEDDKDPYRYQGIGTDEFFGLKDDRDFFPASGAKGPFLYLLQHHPRKGLDFILNLCNLTSKNYAESEFANPTEEDRFSSKVAVTQIKIKMNDGKLINQYTSSYLWQGYRGNSTLPYLLQCALMALENWLIDYVSEVGETNQISWIYDYLLRNSNSVMITSVLSSVAIGFPLKVNKSAFPILNAIELYSIDLARVAQELGGNEQNWFAFNRNIMSEIYIEERRCAALRPWRKESLETLLTRLQFDNDSRNEVLSIVDNLKDIAAIRNEKNLRYLINRIDTRTWEAVDDTENNCIRLQNTSELPDDLKQDQNKFIEKFNFDNSIINLHLWSKKLFEENVYEEKYFPSYTDALDAAKKLLIDLENGKKSDYLNLAIGTLATVAAILIRDKLDNLDHQSIEWCIDIVLESAVTYADAINEATRFDKTDNWGSGACAFVLSKLFSLDLDKEQKDDLKFTLATALTHANLNVCSLAAKGVREFLWSIDSELASNYLKGIVEYAKFRKEESKNQRFHYSHEKELEISYKEYKKQINIFRSCLAYSTFTINVDEINLEKYSSWFIHLSILMIPLSPKDKIHIDLFYKIVNFIFDAEYNEYRIDDERKINHELQKQIQDCFLEQLIYSKNNHFTPFKELLTSGCLRAPSFIYLLKLLFESYAEKEKDFDAIWSLWKILEPELHKIAMNDVNEHYHRLQSDLNRLLRGGLYANTTWTGHENEREFIGKGVENLLVFSKKSGNNSHVFMGLSSLLYNFYDLFFDQGVQILADKFTKNSELIAKQLNTAFYLEMSIARYLQVENRGMLSQKMYQICLTLLTGIIETGSARAYYLRDHLVRSRKIMN
ncbi:ATP-binding protein [Acinetobacter seifertii]|uniref:ATP-binding protein n=2 Tax=Acinetobacter seifertii TaxID=1530123 RepID=A0ABX8LC68_9GAMM|nr:ATP-binding protein [Acinetobacter seifertii]